MIQFIECMNKPSDIEIILLNKYFRNTLLFIVLNIAGISCNPQKQLRAGPLPPGARLIFEEKFEGPLDTVLWKVEMQPSPGSEVKVVDGNLQLKTGAGVTVWLNRLLSGNILITYNRSVAMQQGKFDRLSDLNQFWMASDPQNSNLFTRSGKLQEYDNLQLYYVGMGGNSNTTTRFRRYDGKGNRELISEYKDAAHLLMPNHNYRVEIEVKNGRIRYTVDNVPYFNFTDPSPLKQGFFGFRSTKSNQLISDLKIYQLN